LRVILAKPGFVAGFITHSFDQYKVDSDIARRPIAIGDRRAA
jgi:hypothetical protein